MDHWELMVVLGNWQESAAPACLLSSLIRYKCMWHSKHAVYLMSVHIQYQNVANVFIQSCLCNNHTLRFM